MPEFLAQLEDLSSHSHTTTVYGSACCLNATSVQWESSTPETILQCRRRGSRLTDDLSRIGKGLRKAFERRNYIKLLPNAEINPAVFDCPIVSLSQ